MNYQKFKFLSWFLWWFLSISAILILISNFVFQILIETDFKLKTAMNSIFIILNVIVLGYLLLTMLINVNSSQINWHDLYQLLLWGSYCFYIITALGSTMALLNPQLYQLKAVMTMLSFIAALGLFPILTLKLNCLTRKNQTNWLLNSLLVLYLVINLLLNCVVLLNLNNVIAFLVTVTTLNLIISLIFFGLLTLRSVNLFELKQQQVNKFSDS